MNLSAVEQVSCLALVSGIPKNEWSSDIPFKSMVCIICKEKLKFCVHHVFLHHRGPTCFLIIFIFYVCIL